MSEQAVDIDQLARLARIHFTDAEKQELLQQLQTVIQYCSKLESIPIDGIEPMVHSFEQPDNVWAEDEPIAGLMHAEDCMRNAPKMQDQQWVVPKIL
jgi:aspartyl-tRNA(Asn)/glutamyl-tRNA(Gln) amidotransferase subunit C